MSVYDWKNTNENGCTTVVDFENVGVSKSKELFLKLTNYTKGMKYVEVSFNSIPFFFL